jgi:hypothetical protein
MGALDLLVRPLLLLALIPTWPSLMQQVRVEYEEMRQSAALQGTILLEKNLPQTNRKRDPSRRPSSSTASFLSVETSFARSESSAMGLFVLTSSMGFVRDDDNHQVAIWKLAGALRALNGVLWSSRRDSVVRALDDFRRVLRLFATIFPRYAGALIVILRGSSTVVSPDDHMELWCLLQRVAGSPFAEKAKWLYHYSLKTCSSIVDGFYTLRTFPPHVLVHRNLSRSN